MKVELHINNVQTHEEAVLAVKIYHYIDNAINHPEWLLSEEAKSFDYENEWDSLCDDSIKRS